MGSLSRMASKCIKCPNRLTCDHKKMESEAYLEMPSVPKFATGGIANPENGSMLFGSDIMVDDLVGSLSASLPQMTDALQESLAEQLEKISKQGKEMKFTIGNIK